MSTGLERPGGTSSGLPPAPLTRGIEQKPTSRAPRRGWAPSVRFCLQSRGDDRAPCGARRRTRICTTWTLNPSPPFGINHLGGVNAFQHHCKCFPDGAAPVLPAVTVKDEAAALALAQPVEP